MDVAEEEEGSGDRVMEVCLPGRVKVSKHVLNSIHGSPMAVI